MADTPLTTPLLPLHQRLRQQALADMHQLGETADTSLSVAPSALTALALPDPQTGIPFTGAASQLYGFANLITKLGTGAVASTVAPSVATHTDSIAKQVTDEGAALYNRGVGLPGADAVEAAGQRVREAADKLLPPDQATTPAARIGQEVVRGAASMGLKVPGIDKLPNVARGLVQALLPAAGGGASGAVAQGLGGAISGAAQAGTEIDNSNGNTTQQSSTDDDSTLPVPPIPPDYDTKKLLASFPGQQKPANVDPILSTFPTASTPQSDFDAMVHKSGDEHVSWGQLFQYGAMAAGVVLAHKALSGVMADRVEIARENRYNGGQDLLDADAQGRANGTIGPATPQPEVPLPPRNASPLVPDAVAKASDKVRAAFVDKNARLNTFNDYTAPTPDMAENLRGQTGTLLNEGYVGTRIQHIAETGHDPTSGVSMPSPVDAWNRIGTWDDATKLKLSNAEYAADELDSRAVRARDMNATPNTDETKVGFGAYSDDQLRQYVADGYADPQVAYELQEQQVRNTRMTELLEKSGMIDAATAAKFRNDHPNYLPSSDASGLIADPLKSRDYSNLSGPDAAFVDSWELRKQHFESIIKAREENVARSNIIQNALDFQANNPKAPKMLEMRTNTAGDPVAGPLSVGYRVGGQLHWVDVNNSELRNLLDRPASAQGALIKAASQVAAISRSGTTQTIAALGGAFFQAKNAIRSTVRAGVAARPEMYTGYLDRALGQATSDTLRLPGGLDPTLYAGPIVGTVKNAYGGVLNGWLRLLDDSGPLNPFRTMLRNYYGDAGYQAMIDRAKIAYARSTRGQMAEAGALNAVGMGIGEVPTSQLASRTGQYSVLNATAPDLFMDKGALGGATPTFVRLNNLMQEVSSWVGESAHTFHFDLNKDNASLTRRFGPDAKRQLAFYTRQLTGDVGQHGANPVFRDYASISKYMNVSVQDWANLSDAFARAPFRTTLNYATTVGLPLLASVYTAMLHGPDAINHLFNETTNDQRAANVRFYIPGQLPENSPTIPIPQTERFGVAPLLQLFADMANLQAHPGDATYDWFKHGLEDLFSKHITKASVGGAERGLASAGEIMVPDAAQVALAATTGKRLVLNPVDAVLPNDKPLQQRMLAPAQVGGDPRQANVASDNDINAGAVTSKMFWDVISAVFGATGSGVHEDYKAAAQRYEVTHDPSEAISSFAQSYAQRFEQGLPFLKGVVWNTPDKLSSNTPLAESVKAATDAYRPLLSARNDIRNEGFTRHGGLELPPTPGSTPKIPTDPTMYQMYMVASKLGQKLISAPHAPMHDVEDWQKEIAALPNSGNKPDDIRRLTNQYTRAKEQALQRAAEYVNDGNMMLSQIVGKPVDIRKIKWDKGPEQFNAR